MMKTLLIGEIQAQARELLAKNTELEQISLEEFQHGPSFPEIETVVLRTFTKLGNNELEKLPLLKCVVSCSVGVDNLQLEELQRRKIELIHCPGSNANSVAEHTVYLIAALLRGTKKELFCELKDKTVGIIGLGAIGKLVAKKLTGFEVKVIAFDVVPQNPDLLRELKVEMKELKEVVREADLITVHVPLTKDTEKLINQELLAEMKSNVFFLNTSRAELIDEIALLRHLQEGKLRGLGLDVYSERLKEELLKLKETNPDLNLILTDHVAARGEDSYREMCLQPIKKLLAKITERKI